MSSASSSLVAASSALMADSTAVVSSVVTLSPASFSAFFGQHEYDHLLHYEHLQG